jgi:hypothetical protein
MSQNISESDEKSLEDSKHGIKENFVIWDKDVVKRPSGLNHRNSLDSGKLAGDRLDYFTFNEGEEVFLNHLLFPPLISVAGRKKSKELFCGRLVGCPDESNRGKWSDIKPDNFYGGGEELNIGFPN